MIPLATQRSPRFGGRIMSSVFGRAEFEVPLVYPRGTVKYTDEYMGLEVTMEECVVHGNLRVVFIEMIIVVVDTNDIKWPRTSLEELHCLMACGGVWPCSGH